jgi:hypothetical protein
MAWIAHSLCEPDVTPENGEVSHSEASSIALRTGLLCEEPAFAGWTGVPRAVPLASDCCCFVDAVPVSLMANSAKATITIVQATIEPSPTNLTIAAYT